MSSKEDPRLSREIDQALEGVDLQSVDIESPASGANANRRLWRGTVVGVHGKDVFVDLGPRMQGVCALGEFDESPTVGEGYDFSLRGREDELWLLSRREARELAGWRELEVGSTVEAVAKAVNTGGLELAIGPLSAFMPASQVDLGRVEDLSQFLGRKLVCQVLEVDRVKRRVLLSRRAVLAAEQSEARAEAVKSLTPGSKLRGRVTRIEPFGAFVELGPGLEGLVHVSNISRKRVEKVDEVLSVGQEIEALVLDVKDGGKRIGLGMKQLEPDPWIDFDRRMPEGTVLSGKVVKLMEFGAFVELEPGVEGLVHVSQLAKNRPRRPQDVVQVGEEFSVRVIEVDRHQQRVSLSRLDVHGALLGSEEAADSDAVEKALEAPPERPAGTNLGALFKKALGERKP